MSTHLPRQRARRAACAAVAVLLGAASGCHSPAVSSSSPASAAPVSAPASSGPGARPDSGPGGSDCGVSTTEASARNGKSLEEALAVKLKAQCGGGEQMFPRTLAYDFVREMRTSSSEQLRPAQPAMIGRGIPGMMSERVYEVSDGKGQSEIVYAHDRAFGCGTERDEPSLVFARCSDGRVAVARAVPTITRQVTCLLPGREQRHPCDPATQFLLYRLPAERIEQVFDAGDVPHDYTAVKMVHEDGSDEP